MNHRRPYFRMIIAGAVVAGPVRDACPENYSQSFAALSPPFADYSPTGELPTLRFLASGVSSSTSSQAYQSFGALGDR